MDTKDFLLRYVVQNVYLCTLSQMITIYIVSQIITEGRVTNTEARTRWQERDVLARNYLVATIETQQQRALVNCNTAHEMWMRISAQHLRNAVENQHVLQ